MNNIQPHILYGNPPRQLVALYPEAVQCSSLMPGSAALEDFAPENLASAVVVAPPGTAERRYVLAHALRALAVGAKLTALALNGKGGNRLAAELEHFGCTVEETSRNHFRICTAMRPTVLHRIEEALAEGGPQLHGDLQLWTQPGIFSWDRLDAGSALLLQHLPSFAGDGADLGCGLGVLSRAALGSTEVRSMTLVDIDRRAVAAASRNIADGRARFVWTDLRQEVAGLTALDFAVMNPPFHADGIEDKTLGQLFIERAAAALKPGGVCWLTANRHLPYEALLAKRFRQVERVAEADGFKIYAAEK